MSLMAAGLAASAVSAAAQVAGTVASSKANSRAIKAMEQSLAQREAIINNWYNNEMNTDPMNRPSAVRAMTKLNNMVRQNNDATAGRKAVMGGTNAEVAATKEANAQMVGETMSGIASAADERTDALKNQYMQSQLGLAQEKANITQQQAASQVKAIQNAAAGVSNAAAKTFSAYAAANSPSNTTGNGSTPSGVIVENANHGG